MSWDCLSAEVACMFADYTWRTDDYEMALEIRVASVRKSNAERKAQYRRNNPRQRRRDAEYARQWVEQNREHRRKLDRARYQRNKASMSAAELEARRAHRRQVERARELRKRTEAGLPPPRAYRRWLP